MIKIIVLISVIIFISCSETTSNQNLCENVTCFNGSCNEKTGKCDCNDGFGGENCLECDVNYYMNRNNTCVPKDSSMILIPKGNFKMGCLISKDLNCDEVIEKEHEVYLSNFEIDPYEVTVEQYAQCVANNKCSEPISFNVDSNCNYHASGKLKHPVNCVTWEQANTFCASLNKRLPTEAEWEKSSRGTNGAIYPWGEIKPSCFYANIYEKDTGCETKSTSEVGKKQNGMSLYLVHDTIGNVWEWVNDYYDESYYSTNNNSNPQGPLNGKYKVIKGGGWNFEGEKYLRPAYRGFGLQNNATPSVGFRCAK